MASVQFDPAPTTPDETDAGAYNLPVIHEFRNNGGKVGGPFEGAPMILITTRGAKSGKVRTNPTLFFPLGDDRILVVASNGGADTHPAWYHNVKVNPQVTVETGEETYEATATMVETDSAERDSLFTQAAAQVPAYNDYQSKTERKIPVVILKRKG
ncbi:nitroreductase family deazaflavin-dependent oxidoreductase [Streptomyces sp. 4N509B]|uniref:nitroreductase family deazaflavin-dependent oxidoreductase n=1 Tax=Streptomyces sp. 4N509B TaxID=3457413 RepID=UPI003FD68317